MDADKEDDQLMRSENGEKNGGDSQDNQDSQDSQHGSSAPSSTPPLLVICEHGDEEQAPTLEAIDNPTLSDAFDTVAPVLKIANETDTEMLNQHPPPIAASTTALEELQANSVQQASESVYHHEQILTENDDKESSTKEETPKLLLRVEKRRLSSEPRVIEASTSDSESDARRKSEKTPIRRPSSADPIRKSDSPHIKENKRVELGKFLEALQRKVHRERKSQSPTSPSDPSDKLEEMPKTETSSSVPTSDQVVVLSKDKPSELPRTPESSNIEKSSPNIPTVKPGFSIFVDSPISKRKQLERDGSFDQSSEKRTPVTSPIGPPNQMGNSNNVAVSPIWGSRFSRNSCSSDTPRPTRPPPIENSRRSNETTASDQKIRSPISKLSPSLNARSSPKKITIQRQSSRSKEMTVNSIGSRHEQPSKREDSSTSSKENAKLSKEEREELERKKAKRRAKLDAVNNRQRQLDYPWKAVEGPTDPDEPIKELPRSGCVRYKYRRNATTKILNQHVDLIPSRCVLFRADERQQNILTQRDISIGMYTAKKCGLSYASSRYSLMKQQAPLFARMLGKARDEAPIYFSGNAQTYPVTTQDGILSSLLRGQTNGHSITSNNTGLKFRTEDFAGLNKMDFVKQLACILCARIMKDPVCCLPCMHRFCLSCIQRRFEKRNLRCPRCNTKLYADQPAKRDLPLQELIKRLGFNMRTRYHLPQSHEITSDEEELEEIFDMYGYTDKEKRAHQLINTKLPQPAIPKCDVDFWRNVYDRKSTMWTREDSDSEDIPWKEVVANVPLVEAQRMLPPDYDLAHLTPSQRQRAYRHDYKKFHCNRQHMWPMVRRKDDEFWKRFFIRRKLERITGAIKQDYDSESSSEDSDTRDCYDIDGDGKIQPNTVEVDPDAEHSPYKWPPPVNPNVRRPYYKERPSSASLENSRVVSRATDQQSEGRMQQIQDHSDLNDEDAEFSNLEAPPTAAMQYLSTVIDDRDGNDTPNTVNSGDLGAIRRSTRPRKMTVRAQRFRDTTTPKSAGSVDGDTSAAAARPRNRAKEQSQLRTQSSQNLTLNPAQKSGQRRSRRMVSKKYNNDEWTQGLSEEDDDDDETAEVDDELRRAMKNQTPSTVTTESDFNHTGAKQFRITSRYGNERISATDPMSTKWRRNLYSSFGPKLAYDQQGQKIPMEPLIPPLVLRPDRSSSSKNIKATELIPFFLRVPDEATIMHLILYLNKRLSEVYGIERNTLDIFLLEVKWQCKSGELSILKCEAKDKVMDSSMTTMMRGEQLEESDDERSLTPTGDEPPVLAPMQELEEEAPEFEVKFEQEELPSDASAMNVDTRNQFEKDISTNDTPLKPQNMKTKEIEKQLAEVDDGVFVTNFLRTKKRGRPSRAVLAERELWLQKIIEAKIKKEADEHKQKGTSEEGSSKDAGPSKESSTKGSSNMPAPSTIQSPKSSTVQRPDPASSDRDSMPGTSSSAATAKRKHSYERKTSAVSETPDKSNKKKKEDAHEETKKTTPRRRGRQRAKTNENGDSSDSSPERRRPKRARKPVGSLKEIDDDSEQSYDSRSPASKRLRTQRERISSHQSTEKSGDITGSVSSSMLPIFTNALDDPEATAAEPSKVAGVSSSAITKPKEKKSQLSHHHQANDDVSDKSSVDMPTLLPVEKSSTPLIHPPLQSSVATKSTTISSNPQLSSTANTSTHSPNSFLFQTGPGQFRAFQYLNLSDGSPFIWKPPLGGQIGPIPIQLKKSGSEETKCIKAIPMRCDHPSGQVTYRLAVPVEEMQSTSSSNQWKLEEKSTQLATSQQIIHPSSNSSIQNTPSSSNFNVQPSKQFVISVVDASKSVKEVLSQVRKSDAMSKTLLISRKDNQELKNASSSPNPQTTSWIASLDSTYIQPQLFRTSPLPPGVSEPRVATPSSCSDIPTILSRSGLRYAFTMTSPSPNDDVYGFHYPHVVLPFDLTLGELRARRPDKNTFLSIIYSIRDKNDETG